MNRTGASAAAETIDALDVSHVFGNPGTTELPLIEAITDQDIQYVTCLHEDVAVGAAAGYATRRLQRGDEPTVPVGVANVHTTPGVVHALGNLYGAAFGDVPVLLTAGCQEARHERRNPPLSGDRRQVVDQWVKHSESVPDPDSLPDAVISAIRTSLRPPMGPTYLELPLSVQESPTNASVPSLGTIAGRAPPDPDAVQDVAARLAGRSVTIVAGAAVGRAGPDAMASVTRLAERLEAPVFGEPFFSTVPFPTDHPHWVGMLPLEATTIRERLASDLVVMVGCRRPEPLLDYEPPLWPSDSTGIWIGPEAPATSDYDIVVTGEIGAALDGLLAASEPTMAADGGVAAVKEDHRAAVTTPGSEQSAPELAAKIELVEAMSPAIENAVVVEEGVTTGFLLRDLATLPLEGFIGHSSGGLGYGLPAALGAAIAEQAGGGDPTPVVALIGDGALQYYPQTLYTVARDVEGAFVVVVPDNRGYGILRDRRRIDEAGESPPLTFGEASNPAATGAAYGMRTRVLEDPAATGWAIDAAIENGGATLISVDVSGAG